MEREGREGEGREGEGREGGGVGRGGEGSVSNQESYQDKQPISNLELSR